jgi:hypothetical protein
LKWWVILCFLFTVKENIVGNKLCKLVYSFTLVKNPRGFYSGIRVGDLANLRGIQWKRNLQQSTEVKDNKLRLER